MTTHILHSVTFNDGVHTTVTLEPPAWRDLSSSWDPVEVSSMFEAYDGSATKQVNSGATQKWRLRIDVTGCREPGLQSLNQNTTWTITLISRDSVSAATGYTVWPVGPPQQRIAANGGERTWSMEFRQA